MRAKAWIPVAALVLGGAAVVAHAVAVSSAGVPDRVITLTSDLNEQYTNPSGAMEDMPATSLTFDTKNQSLVTVSFSARGTVAPSGSAIIPIMFISASLDGVEMEPGQIEYLFPQFCCDTRSMSWVTPNVNKGVHTVQIRWGMGNPTLGIISSRSLIVGVARQ